MPMTSAEERRKVYDRLGLRSWEIAQAEAKYRQDAKQRVLIEQAKKHGMPNFVGAEGESMQFSDPTGIKRTFSPGGDQTSFTLPSHMVEPDLLPQQREELRSLHRVRHGIATGVLDFQNYKEQYSPQDQRLIEKLQNSRSQAAVDPELDDLERQQVLDKIDAAISRVPRVSPMMKEPTAQQKFEARLIKGPDGKQYYLDNQGNPKPLEWSKQSQEEATEYRKYYSNQLADMTKENDKLVEPTSPDIIAERARWMADLAFGKIQTKSFNQELDLLWQATMTRLDESQWGRANKKQTFAAMEEYIRLAMEKKGVTESQARADFMNRWSYASDGGEYEDLLPKMNSDEKRKHRYVGVTAALESDPSLGDFDEVFNLTGLRRGEGRVAVDGKTVSTFDGLPIVTTDAEYDALPSGTIFLDPDGIRRKKP